MIDTSLDFSGLNDIAKDLEALILLEGNMLLHHLYGHLSQRVPYGGYWQERTMKILRYKSLC